MKSCRNLFSSSCSPIIDILRNFFLQKMKSQMSYYIDPDDFVHLKKRQSFVFVSLPCRSSAQAVPRTCKKGVICLLGSGKHVIHRHLISSAKLVE
jgi:hypothetical protein